MPELPPSPQPPVLGAGGGRDAPSRPSGAATRASFGCVPSATSWRPTTPWRCGPSWRPPRSARTRAEAEVAARRWRRGAAPRSLGRPPRRPSGRPRSAEAAVNKAWRDASTELERLRETYEDEDRLRGDIERRIREAERLHPRGAPGRSRRAARPSSPTTTRSRRSRSESELVQRRLALLGRVNLLATGEFEALQERHDFMASRARRREARAPRPPRGDRAGRSGDHRDVHDGLSRRRDAVRAPDRGAVPRRRRPAGAHRSGRAAHERHRDRGEPRSQAREAHLAAVGRRALAHGHGVPVRDLHGPAIARST